VGSREFAWIGGEGGGGHFDVSRMVVQLGPEDGQVGRGGQGGVGGVAQLAVGVRGRVEGMGDGP
jgi:hypothetical protein